jgi:DNA-binding phage protein
MMQLVATQSSKTVPPDLLEKLHAERGAIAAEFPEAAERAERLREAAAENTVSGHVRGAVHRSQRPLDTIARDVGITAELLCDWLSGDRTLRSDVLDRVAQAVGANIAVTLRSN